jgi:hypothetical protein
MSRKADLASLGLVPAVANLLGIDVATALAALGNSSQANGFKVTATVSNFATVTDSSADSAVLPSAATYRPAFVVIRNSGAGTLKVYPASGEKINGGSANAVQNLTTGVGRIYFKQGADNWITVS